MIEVKSIFQQRNISDDRIGDGSFGYTQVGKIELAYILQRLVTSGLTNIEVIIESSHRKKLTGLGTSKNVWSKAKGGSRNIMFDPTGRDDSIVAIVSSVLDLYTEATGKTATSFEVESDVVLSLKANKELYLNSSINNFKIICN